MCRVLLFFGPQPPAPALGPLPQPPAPFTVLQPPAKITFSCPLTMELLFHGPPASKVTFSWPLVTTTVCHVFFIPLNKTQPTTYSKIPFSKKSYHK